MSLYNAGSTLTAQTYESVLPANATSADPKPFTATGNDSDATFRGSHAAQNPPNPMKGGYTYKRNTRRSRSPRSHKRTKSTSVSSVLGMDVSYRGKMGGKRRRSSRRTLHKSVGITLARGRSGGSRRRSRRHRKRHLKGGDGFPVGYSIGGPLNHNLSALANGYATPYYN
jgi:hypothetical protein